MTSCMKKCLLTTSCLLTMQRYDFFSSLAIFFA